MSDWDNYSENLAFDPANSMPRCDIEELQNKLAHSEKMRDLQAEYACKLEEKIRNQSIQLIRLEKKNNNKSENLKNLTFKHKKLKYFNKELYHKLYDFKKLEEKLRISEDIITQARDTAYDSCQTCPKCELIDKMLTDLLTKIKE